VTWRRSSERSAAGRHVRGGGRRGGVAIQRRREVCVARMAEQAERRATGAQDARRERPLDREPPAPPDRRDSLRQRFCLNSRYRRLPTAAKAYAEQASE